MKISGGSWEWVEKDKGGKGEGPPGYFV